ncbi:MAG: chromosome segregation protein SMC [Tissierellia bacterium]|nr:chromosome segregation protein SMC [Tissierellia bacterium]
MYLKEMELYGFKSFARRTTINFSQGITGIVGPNGSGKSNIIDGILWVLGESSPKQLRGSKMEDVIFSGTESRNSLGYAEVRLLFDNEDGYLPLPYKEISVGRKLFRSGESVYSINKQRVRLKDIHDLFLDTGIGKNGYSFIGQGQIDQILSNKPQDRRKIFEEAAGISKFKEQRDQSLRNLQGTVENLDRVEDIYVEVSHQKEQLEGERTLAIRAQELNRQISAYGSSIHAKERKKYREAYERDRREASSLRKRLEELMEEEGEVRSLREEVKGKLLALEEGEASSREGELARVRKKEQWSAKLEQYRREEADWQREAPRIQRERSALEAKLAQHLHERTEIREALEELVVSLREAEAEEKRAREGYLAAKGALERARSESQEEEEELRKRARGQEEHRARLDALGLLLTERKNRTEELKRRYHSLQEQSKESLEYREKTKGELLQLQGEMERKLREEEDLSRELKGANEQLTALAAEGRATEKKLQEVENERNLTRRLVLRHEGYSSGVRAFLESSRGKDYQGEIYGTVAEILEIEPGFETAIATALGGAAQNIVIKSDRHLKAMLADMAKLRAGRVTLLPIGNIRGRGLDPWAQEILDKSGLPHEVASHCVRHQPQFQPVVDQLLARTLIAKDATLGLQLSKSLKGKFRVVTLEGDIFQTGGAVTGGRQKYDVTDLFNRKKTLQALEDQWAHVKENFEKQRTQYQELAERAQVLHEGAAERAQNLEGLRSKKRELEQRLVHQNQASGELSMRMEQFQREIEGESEAIREAEGEVAERTAALQALEIQEVARSSQDLSLLEARVEEALEEGKEWSLQVSGWKSSLEQNRSRLRFLKEQRQDLEERIHQLSRNLEAGEEKTLENQRALVQLEEALKGWEEEQLLLNEQWERARRERSQYHERREELEEALVRLSKDRAQVETNLEKVTERAEGLQERLASNPMEGEDPFPEESLTAIQRKLKEGEGELLALGPVNYQSIEQFDEVLERYEFLGSQIRDLNLAKEKLTRVIASLEGQMRKQFVEKMDEIHRAFQGSFKRLFSGGKAYLRWDQEGDPLETGIFIEAQPPGKRLQALSLLSGGERAMTAVALLFALLEVRRSPFCVLDEMDAALDEENIRRYSLYVEQLEDIQFIMITHRKSSMALCQRLFGVTMEEKGVSTVLSMELEEVQHYVQMD